LWWSVVTLTTIGYGDVYPQTMLGKVLTGITAIIGVGLIATPAGILAGSFGDALQRQRDKDHAQL
jgi:voltage-gated potassium channel